MNSLSASDGSRVEFSVRGDGPPVLLIHAGVFADWFLPMTDEPSLADFQLVRLRRAGYVAGHQPSGHVSLAAHAAHAASVADHLGIRDALVVGHSSSALIALELAASRPDLVAGLVLLEPAPGGGLADAAIRNGIGELVAAAPTPEAAYDMFMSVACSADHRTVVESSLGPDGLNAAIAQSRWFFADEIAAVEEWAFERTDAAAIRQPTTLVVGDAGGPLYDGVIERLADWLPDARVVRVTGGDHLLPLRDPHRMAAIVKDATSRIARPTAT